MKKNILVIDDSPDLRGLALLKEELEQVLNDNSHIQYEVNITVINPNDHLQFGNVEEALKPLCEYLTGILNKKLDLFMCDFNLHVSNKDLAFYIIDHVRNFNKCCSIILYSGSPLKELTRINNQELANQISTHIKVENPQVDVEFLKSKIDKVTKSELPSEELLKLALEADITKIVSRTEYIETAIEIIKSPALLLRLENNLLAHGDQTIFNSVGMSLDGHTIENICEHIRMQTSEGILFSNELIELMSAHYANLSSN